MTRYYISYVNDGIRYYIGYDGEDYYLTDNKMNASKYFTEQAADLIIKDHIVPILPNLIKDYEKGYFELIIEVTAQGKKFDANGNSISL